MNDSLFLIYFNFIRLKYHWNWPRVQSNYTFVRTKIQGASIFVVIKNTFIPAPDIEYFNLTDLYDLRTYFNDIERVAFENPINLKIISIMFQFIID